MTFFYQAYVPCFGTFSFYIRSMIITHYCRTLEEAFRSMIITHYCRTLEEALKQAKQAGKQPGCEFWGITISGRKGFAVYKNGMLVERYIKK